MSYGYKKASKKDEAELKEYTEAKVEIEESKADSKGLQKALEKEGIDFATFARSDESYRKRVLKDKHADLKLKHGWTYDQPIE